MTNVRDDDARPGQGRAWLAAVGAGSLAGLMASTSPVKAAGPALGAGAALVAFGLYRFARKIEHRVESLDLRLLVDEGKFERSDERVRRLLKVVEHDVRGPAV